LQSILAGAPGPRLALEVCHTWADAQKFLAEGGWDVVLLDPGLPDSQGTDTIDACTKVAPDVPIVVLTGHASEALAVQSVRRGAQDYLVKGEFDADLLLRAVRYAIERRRAQVALRRSEARLGAVFQHLPEGVVLLDGEGKLLLVNPTASAFLPSLVEGAIQVGEPLGAVGGLSLHELLEATSDGGWHEVVEQAAPSRTFDVRAGRLSRSATGNLLVVIRDMTEARHLQRRLTLQQRLAAVGELASGIAHDFENVMQVIIGTAELLSESDELTPLARERAEYISRRGRTAARIIQQILADGERSVLERRQFDLGEFLDDVVTVLAKESTEDIRWQVRGAPQGITVHEDPTQLQRLLTNLAADARTAVLAGESLTISVEEVYVAVGARPPVDGMLPGPWVRLRVGDLAPELDIHLAVEAGAARAPTEFDLADKTETAADRTVLVVEDEDDVRQLIADILTHLGYSPLTASNGAEALQVYRENQDRVGLVLTDKTMPEMGGIELARALHVEFPGVKVLILTGYRMTAKDKEVDDIPSIFGWVQKPIEIEHLAKVVEAAFDAG
jgi:CheY-like chemotaxis protein/nitrogen-specific signal transduction histidine kinase